MSEDVQAGHRLRQLFAFKLAQEDRLRHQVFQPSPARPIADDDQLNPRQIIQYHQIADLFFAGQPAHVANQHLAVGGPAAPQLFTAFGRIEAHRVDASAPDPNPRDTLRDQLVSRKRGGSKVQRGQGMNLAYVIPQQGFGFREAIAGGVGRDLGLVDADHRNAQLGCHRCGLIAHDKRCGQMNHIGPEIGQQPF